MKYRRKSAVVEAVQHFADMGNHTAVIPQWLIQACSTGVVFCVGAETRVNTPAGIVSVKDGDWILRGADGYLLALTQGEFEAAYEPVQ